MAVKVSPSPADLNIKMTNILKIENFINDQSYSELIEYSANFNARLCIERRLRLPFLDPQTNIAQKHSNLYLKKSQRLPGFRDGQIYTYPSPRWRCKKNSMKYSSRPFYRFRASDNCTTMVAASHSVSVAPPSVVVPPVVVAPDADANDFQAMIDAESNSMGAADTDSKDSHQNMKEESMTKDWFFDDMDANDIGSEEQPDSDFDYNINGYKRKRRPVTTRKAPSRKPTTSEPAKKSRSGGGSASSSSRNRSSSSRKSSSRSASKGSKTEGGNRNFADVEPPSFADVESGVQGDLIDGAFRSF